MTSENQNQETLKNSIAFYRCEIQHNFKNLMDYSLDVYITKSISSRSVTEFTLLVTCGGPRIELVFRPNCVYLNYYEVNFASVENFVCDDKGYFEELEGSFVYDAI